MYASLFFFNDAATPEIYTLPLHGPLPIYRPPLRRDGHRRAGHRRRGRAAAAGAGVHLRARRHPRRGGDRPAGARGPDRGRGRAGAVRRLMRVLPSGSTALLVEVDGLDEVLGLYAALTAEPVAGVVRSEERRVG